MKTLSHEKNTWKSSKSRDLESRSFASERAFFRSYQFDIAWQLTRVFYLVSKVRITTRLSSLDFIRI